MFNQNRKPLYSSKSLARLSSPEGLDEMMKVVNKKSWLVLIAFTSIVLTGVIWSIFGHIPIIIEVKGQLVNSGPIKSIESLETGRIQALKVKNGDTVEQGQVLAVIEKFNSKGNSIRKEIISNFSGTVLETLQVGENIDTRTTLVIIEKNDSSTQKSIFCSSSLEDCQKIRAGMKVQITASEIQEQFYATIKEVLLPINFEEEPVSLSKNNDKYNNFVSQNKDKTIQILEKLEINNITKEKLEKHPNFPVSIRVVKESSPISFIFPKSELDNGTK